MRIGVDGREIQDGVVTGIGRSLANFIRYFGKHEKVHTLVMFSHRPVPIDFHGNMRRVVLEPSPTLIWDQWHLPMALKENRIDLFYSPYYKIPLCIRIPVVNQILDLMYLIFPPYRKDIGSLGRLYYATFGKAFARKSISIITDSRHARDDIIRIWKVKSGKITVIPLGVANRYVPMNDESVLRRVRIRFGLPDNYILYLGNFKPHKNVATLVHAFKRIEKSFPEYKLILAGPLDLNGVQMQTLVSKEGLEDRVVFTDTVREEDCPEALLSMADLFVFPTLYEGFGLPPLEAMACGTPVITSNLTAVPEVVGEAGVMVNPLDVNEMSWAMAALLEDPEKRVYYSRRGLERAKIFSEEKTAGRIYQHILNLLEDIR
jgi:glycosyltransferase involved in cell wall biosynthesis